MILQNGFVEELAKKAISAGPWGGQDGMLFDDGVNSAMRQVVINHGTSIDSIQTEYEQNGSSYWSSKHGGRGGYKTNTVSPTAKIYEMICVWFIKLA